MLGSGGARVPIGTVRYVLYSHLSTPFQLVIYSLQFADAVFEH